ncbi:MAG TPA: ArsI/CadI family heavy metal resistance metalloenzyme [Pyrinomonadaceae bacterium]|nr:ArsI/CadI family heavy metal resistance metalloenzyme [Pyrinomonadaceae bacterium]
MLKTEAKTVRALKAHLALNVKDVEQSIGFYTKLFGIEPSKVRRGYAKFNVENPPLNFTLNQVPFGERGALSHLGIQVASTDDVLATRERWADEGLVTRDEMQTDCCYALQDKAWVRDPDGNEWEVFVVLEDNLAETTATADCCVTDADGQAVCATTGEAVSAAAGAPSCCGTEATEATTTQTAASCCAPASTVTLSR